VTSAPPVPGAPPAGAGLPPPSTPPPPPPSEWQPLPGTAAPSDGFAGEPLRPPLANARFNERAPLPPAERRALYLGGTVGFAVAEVPQVSASMMAHLSWEAEGWSLGLDASLTAPGGMDVGGGRVEALLFDVGPSACLRWSRFGLCGVLRLGAMESWATGLFGIRGTQTTATMAVGVRPFVDFAVGEVARVRLSAALELRPLVSVLELGSTEVWRTPLLSFSLGGGVVFRALGDALP
jgi:hypothetical protein